MRQTSFWWKPSIFTVPSRGRLAAQWCSVYKLQSLVSFHWEFIRVRDNSSRFPVMCLQNRLSSLRSFAEVAVNCPVCSRITRPFQSGCKTTLKPSIFAHFLSIAPNVHTILYLQSIDGPVHHPEWMMVLHRVFWQIWGKEKQILTKINFLTTVWWLRL